MSDRAFLQQYLKRNGLSVVARLASAVTAVSLLVLCPLEAQAQTDGYVRPQNPKFVEFVRLVKVDDYVDFVMAATWREARQRLETANPHKQTLVEDAINSSSNSFRGMIVSLTPHSAEIFARQQKVSIDRALKFAQSGPAASVRDTIPLEMTICLVNDRPECGPLKSVIAAARRKNAKGQADYILAVVSMRAGALAMMQLGMASGNPLAAIDGKVLTELGLRTSEEGQSHE